MSFQLWHPLVTLLLVLSVAGASAQTQAPAAPALASVAEVLALDARDAGSHPRDVRLRGVVLGVNAAGDHLILHDGRSSVGVDLKPPVPHLKQGDTVEVLGQTKTARFGSAAHPRVSASAVRVTGTAPLPKPREVDVSTLASFRHFDQWVSFECFVMEWVHSGGELLVRTISRGGYTSVTVRMPASAIPPNLHGARLRFTGVSEGNHTIQLAMSVYDAALMEVLEPGTADIFDAPLASVADLVARKVEPGRRWRTRGVVAAVTQQRRLMLATPEGGMTAYLLVPRGAEQPGTIYGDAGSWLPPQPGDVVELVGSTFETSQVESHSQGLSWCHLRLLGHEAPPTPKQVDLTTLLGWRDHDEWCSVEAIVTGWTQRGGARMYAVVDAHGWATFHVRDVFDAPFPQSLHGARLRFTGMSRSRLSNSGDALLVPNPAFVEVVQPGTADAFAVPEVSMSEILAQRTPSPERVRTRGVVIGHASPSIVHVRGTDAAMCVSLQNPWAKSAYFSGEFYADAGPLPKLKVGDEVELAGCPIQPRVGVEVAGCDFYQTHARVLHNNGVPSPIASTITDIARGAHTNELVEVRGRIVTLQQAPAGREWLTTVLLEAGGESIPAVYQGQQIAEFRRLKPDYDVLVRGLVHRARPDSPRQIWLADGQGVQVLGLSPEIFTRRLWMWGGGGAAVVLLLLGWVFMLRRNARIISKNAAELKAASEAARESEQRWKLLFEQSPLSVQMFHPNGQTKRFNQAWKNLFRLNDEQGHAFNVLKDPDLNASGAVNLIRKAFEGEVVHVPPVPFPVNTDPPEVRWIGGVLYPVKNEAGQIIEVVTIHNDITEMKRAEEAMRAINHTLEKRVEERTVELQQAQGDLQRALEQERDLGELKTRFVTMVSHEFRTPLGIIMSSVELLQHYSDRLPEDEKTRQLQEIQSSTKHMGGLMEQVLLLGRAEAGKLTCKPRPLDLAAFAERIIDETHSISNRKCPIMLLVEGDLHGALVDETLLRHITSNLVGNAVKYSPEGSEVMLRLRREGPNAAIVVSDRGIGIPAKDRDRLFEAFHRCSNVGDTPGTGLGLVIMKRCVDLHGGAISIDSEPGRGTTFTVRLPVFTATDLPEP